MRANQRPFLWAILFSSVPPSNSLAFDSCIVSGTAEYRCAALGMEFPGHRQEHLTQTLIVCLLKTHSFTMILDCEKSTE